MSIHWIGTHPRVNIMDPELIREVLSNKFGHFAKPESNPLTKLLATGLVNYDGEKWAKHRRILNPAFHQEKLKVCFLQCKRFCLELPLEHTFSLHEEQENIKYNVKRNCSIASQHAHG